MRATLLLLTGITLVWGGEADATSPETACENGKLRAAGAYARCLSRAAREANSRNDPLSDEALEHCNRRFDRAFERAEAQGGCRTAGGPSSIRGPILDQASETFEVATGGSSCPTPPAKVGSTYVCTLVAGEGHVAVDLTTMINQIGDDQVTADSVVWIEGWGGQGASGNQGSGGAGGVGGYAQTATTVNDLVKSSGSSVVYYYLGATGVSGHGFGGSGGAASLVTTNDLLNEAPDLNRTLLIAGGGGGGGSNRSPPPFMCEIFGADGGKGGSTIASTLTPAYGAGARGGSANGTNVSGTGGGGTSVGSGGTTTGGDGTNGATGIAAGGGQGGCGCGSGGTGGVGYVNQANAHVGGAGGSGGPGGDEAGGGGGGGGYGGGGGGSEGFGDTNCVAGGGGGGGAFAMTATQSCTRIQPANPSAANGAVQIVFQIGKCGG